MIKKLYLFKNRLSQSFAILFFLFYFAALSSHESSSSPAFFHVLECVNGYQTPVVLADEAIFANDGWIEFSLWPENILALSVDGGIYGTVQNLQGEEEKLDFVLVKSPVISMRSLHSKEIIEIPWSRIAGLKKAFFPPSNCDLHFQAGVSEARIDSLVEALEWQENERIRLEQEFAVKSHHLEAIIESYTLLESKFKKQSEYFSSFYAQISSSQKELTKRVEILQEGKETADKEKEALRLHLDVVLELYTNNLKNGFLTANVCLPSCLASRQWSLVPEKNFEHFGLDSSSFSLRRSLLSERVPLASGSLYKTNSSDCLCIDQKVLR